MAYTFQDKHLNEFTVFLQLLHNGRTQKRYFFKAFAGCLSALGCRPCKSYLILDFKIQPSECHSLQLPEIPSATKMADNEAEMVDSFTYLGCQFIGKGVGVSEIRCGSEFASECRSPLSRNIWRSCIRTSTKLQQCLRPPYLPARL